MRAVRFTLLLVAVAGLAWFSLSNWPKDDVTTPTAWAVGNLLGGKDDGFARVEGPAPFVFPRDHGPHPGYRHEWWYLTGHLDADDGRRFGFQLTFFRFGLASPATLDDRGSAWRSDAIYMAHFGITDVAGQRLLASERFGRPVLGLAGARAEPFAVWIEGWRLDGGGDAIFPMQLEAEAGSTALSLSLQGGKPVVAQGDGGTSRKGPGVGNATRYYSFPRLEARGHLRLGGNDIPVSGTAWLDREWGSSALGAGVRGWDWFGLQLEDGRDLMLFRLRREDGAVDPFSAGSMVAVDGTVSSLTADDFVVEVLDHWRSEDGIAYPSRWRLQVPDHGLDVEVVPLVADQELRLAVRYWEGAVDVTGSVSGHGYVELTGYAGVRVDGAPR